MTKQKRTAYAAFEKTIIDLYDQELLTLNRLDLVAARYRWIPLDSAGTQHRVTRDGKDLYQVCIELVDPSFPMPARGSAEDHEEYWERELKKWEDILRWRWDWHAYGVISPSSWQNDDERAA
ncbi:MAG TPA: hypothetical protein VN729_05540 [Ktedonobacteraceae bacterium]|nr:hypothetical protein [Ktedonobacteraceae bacterium]